jgi:uncharacterized protein YndB with AHSA1/START domain
MQMAKSQTLKFKRTVNAPPAEVYRALTSSTALREWFSDVAFSEPRAGGRWYAAWNRGYYVMGEFTKVNPGRKFSITWLGQGEPAATTVKVSVAEKKGGTGVTVEQESVGTGNKWADPVRALTRLWERALENLQSVMETGEDLRFTLRPMLGISGMEDVNAEVVARLGVPPHHGMRIDGTVAGMGAEAAGLQKDDVILSIGGAPVDNFATLTNALADHRAGDTVPVVLYRAGQKLTLSMTLSKRPLPEIPTTALGLSEAVRAIYNAENQALDTCLKGATDVEANYRIAPGEWTVKEVLAHLLHNERTNQQQIAELSSGIAPFYDGFGSNSQAWVQATANSFASLAAMVKEVKRSQAETVGLLAGLPDAFVARKSSYWQIAYTSLQSGFHSSDHFGQMAASLAAARAAPAVAPA